MLHWHQLGTTFCEISHPKTVPKNQLSYYFGAVIFFQSIFVVCMLYIYIYCIGKMSSKNKIVLFILSLQRFYVLVFQNFQMILNILFWMDTILYQPVVFIFNLLVPCFVSFYWSLHFGIPSLLQLSASFSPAS